MRDDEVMYIRTVAGSGCSVVLHDEASNPKSAGGETCPRGEEGGAHGEDECQHAEGGTGTSRRWVAFTTGRMSA